MSPDRVLPPPAMAIQRWLLFVAAIFAVVVLVIVYQWGYDRGRGDSSLAFARRADCRAELAVSLNKAKDGQQSAFGIGLVAALAADDPGVQKRLHELYEETPDEVFKAQVLQIIDRSTDIKKESRKQGDPVARCRDGKP